MLDGVFAFALYDTNTNKIYLARDRFGIRPMFIRKIYSNFNHPFKKLKHIYLLLQ